jgi:hypothetical protein
MFEHTNKDSLLIKSICRRRLLRVLRLSLASSIVVSALAHAQPQAPTPVQAVGVFSMLGDAVQVTVATEAPTDTRLERTGRASVDFKNIGFDLIAIQVARQALEQAYPKAEVNPFRSTQTLSPKEQRELAEGASRGELPDWMVRTIISKKLTHALLITRSRGSADIRIADGSTIGRGTAEGIGFYIDKLYRIRNTRTGVLSDGVLAPYVQMRLSLLDTQTAEMVASYDIRDGVALGASDERPGNDPWVFMSNDEKTAALRTLVQESMTRGMQNLLAKR